MVLYMDMKINQQIQTNILILYKYLCHSITINTLDMYYIQCTNTPESLEV